MKVALLGDTHFSARGSSQIFNEYFLRFFNNIFFPYLRDNHIHHVIQAGDFFDRRKFIDYRTLHSTREEVVERFEDEQIQLHIIPGNHDEALKNSGKINSLNELFGDRYSYVDIIQEVGEVRDFDGIKIGFVPWINAENEKQAIEYLKKTGEDVIVGHFEIVGCEFMKGVKSDKGFQQKVFNHIPLVVSGHYHTSSRNKNIQYLGTPYEIMWSDYNDPKGFWILETNDLSLQFVSNPYTIHHKIFYKEQETYSDDYLNEITGKYVKIYIISKDDEYEFQKFLDRVNSKHPLSVAIYQSEETVEMNDVSNYNVNTQSALDVLKSKVEEIDDDNIDREKMKTITEEIYKEAEDMLKDNSN